MKKVAVIDLGTNTFNLLLAEIQATELTAILKKEEPVRLGEGGLTQNTISDAAFERGLQTLQYFEQLIQSAGITLIKAVATSAIRNANNAPLFIRTVKEKTGIAVDIINGEDEAGLIYQGVKASGLLSGKTALIMDIGGGSVEFIIGNKDQVYWKQSFEMGVVRLLEKFHQTDPIPADQLKAMSAYLQENLKSLMENSHQYQPHGLIGAAGVFETFKELCDKKQHAHPLKNGYEFKMDDFNRLVGLLRESNHQERLAMEEIIELRKDTVVPAALLVNFVLSELQIEKFLMCDYSLKEGLAVSLSNC